MFSEASNIIHSWFRLFTRVLGPVELLKLLLKCSISKRWVGTLSNNVNTVNNSFSGSRRAGRRLKWSRVAVRRIQRLVNLPARDSTEIWKWEAGRRQENLLHTGTKGCSFDWRSNTQYMLLLHPIYCLDVLLLCFDLRHAWILVCYPGWPGNHSPFATVSWIASYKDLLATSHIPWRRGPLLSKPR